MHPFDEERLTALYPRHQRYVHQVLVTTLRSIIQRYITFEDGLEIIRHAQRSDVPEAADIPSDIPDDLP